MTNGATSNLTVSGGDFTGITTLTNDASGVAALEVNAGRMLSAANIVNHGNLGVAGTLNSAGTIANDGNLVVDPTGTINASINSTGGGILLSGTINGNVALTSNIASMVTSGGGVTGRVTLAVAGAHVNAVGGGGTFGSVAGVAGSLLDTGAFTLTVGGDNSSSDFAGFVTGSGSFIKTGSGAMSLSGDSGAYTGTMTVNGGTLGGERLDRAVAAATVNAGGTLGGNGTVGNTTINAAARWRRAIRSGC